MNLNVAKAVDAFRSTYNAQLSRPVEREVFITPNQIVRDLIGDRGAEALAKIDAFNAAVPDFFKSFRT